MRTRCWRRYQEELKVKQRLQMRRRVYSYWRFTDVNNNNLPNLMWIDLIGSQFHFLFKNNTCSTSRYNYKYGSKGKKRYRDYSSKKTRIWQKKYYKSMLKKDYGITHLNFKYESITNYTQE
jgi:hypothetical protein